MFTCVCSLLYKMGQIKTPQVNNVKVVHYYARK